MGKDPLAQFRSALYRLARLLGDLQAARRGPKALAKRMVRKALWRKLGRGLGPLK